MRRRRRRIKVVLEADTRALEVRLLRMELAISRIRTRQLERELASLRALAELVRVVG